MVSQSIWPYCELSESLFSGPDPSLYPVTLASPRRKLKGKASASTTETRRAVELVSAVFRRFVRGSGCLRSIGNREIILKGALPRPREPAHEEKHLRSRERSLV